MKGFQTADDRSLKAFEEHMNTFNIFAFVCIISYVGSISGETPISSAARPFWGGAMGGGEQIGQSRILYTYMVWLGLKIEIFRLTQTMYKGFLVTFENQFYRTNRTKRNSVYMERANALRAPQGLYSQLSRPVKEPVNFLGGWRRSDERRSARRLRCTHMS